VDFTMSIGARLSPDGPSSQYGARSAQAEHGIGVARRFRRILKNARLLRQYFRDLRHAAGLMDAMLSEVSSPLKNSRSRRAI
jgi:hypothetical protein